MTRIVAVFLIAVCAVEASVIEKNETCVCKESGLVIELNETDVKEIVWELTANKTAIGFIRTEDPRENKSLPSFVRSISMNHIRLTSCMDTTCRVLFNNKDELWVYYNCKDAQKIQEGPKGYEIWFAVLSCLILAVIGFTLLWWHIKKKKQHYRPAETEDNI